MLDLLVDPDAFFEREVADPDLVVGAVIVLLTGVLTSVSAILEHRHMNEALQHGPGGGQQTFLVISIVLEVALLAVLWVAFTGVFYGVASLLDDQSEGSFTDVLALTAWGHVPIALAGVVTAAATFVALQGISQATDHQSLMAVSQSLQNSQIVELSSYAVVAFTLWQGALWTVAVEHGLGVERQHAALAVVGPLALVVGWHLLSFLGGPALFLPGP